MNIKTKLEVAGKSFGECLPLAHAHAQTDGRKSRKHNAYLTEAHIMGGRCISYMN